jgi:hypothetical protein
VVLVFERLGVVAVAAVVVVVVIDYFFVKSKLTSLCFVLNIKSFNSNVITA